MFFDLAGQMKQLVCLSVREIETSPSVIRDVEEAELLIALPFVHFEKGKTNELL
jgi:hypothetical protein